MTDLNLKLSANFTWAELTNTTHLDLLEANRAYAEGFVKPLTDLCVTILQPIREHYQKSVIISSGVRCPALNDLISFAKPPSSSQHVLGQAADFTIPGIELVNIWDWVKVSGLPFGQVILEGKVVHVSLGYPYRPKWKSGEALIIT